MAKTSFTSCVDAPSNHTKIVPRKLGAVLVEAARLILRVDSRQGGQPTPEQTRKLGLLLVESWLAEYVAKADWKRDSVTKSKGGRNRK